MGKITNLLNAKVSGNVGAMNFRRRGADTVVAERSYTNKSGGNGATEAQRLHRCRLGNVVGVFRVIQAIEAKAWEAKAPYVSDFNMLSKINLATSPIFLTKEEVQLSASVIAPYIVSRGTLPSLDQYFDDTALSTGVNVGLGVNWGTVSVAELSRRIVANNPNWLEGDKLSFAKLEQQVNVISGVNVPQIKVTYFELTLDYTNMALVGELPNAGEVQPEELVEGTLAFLDGGDAAFAIHSRRSTGELLTSEQRVIIRDEFNPTYVKYKSDDQKARAMNSYGYQGEVLLTPYSEGRPDQPDAPAFEGVTLNGNPVELSSYTNERGELIIKGRNLNADVCYLVVNGARWSPQSVSPTEIKYSLDNAGTANVFLNGDIVFYWWARVPASDVTITTTTFDGRTYSGSKSGISVAMSDSFDTRAVNFDIVGTGLQPVTGNGCTLTLTTNTATHVAGKAEIGMTIGEQWSILANGTVALSGSVEIL